MASIPNEPDKLQRILRRCGFSKYEVALSFISILSLALQLYIAPHTTSRVDIAYYFKDAQEIVIQRRYFSFYRHTIYEYPPVWAYYIALVYLIHPVSYWREPGFLTLIKLPLIISDIMAGLLLYYYVKTDIGPRKALLYSGLLLFHPHLTFISAMWGMNDSICTLFLLSSVFYLKDGRLRNSAVMMSLALLIKQYAFLPIPPVLGLILKKYGKKEALVFFTLALLPLALISIPYLIVDPEPYFRAITFNVLKPQTEIRLKSGGFWRFIKYIIENHTTLDKPQWLLDSQYPLFFIGYLLITIFYYQKVSGDSKRVGGFLANDSVLLPSLYFLVFCPVVHPQWYVLLMPFICIRFPSSITSATYHPLNSTPPNL